MFGLGKPKRPTVVAFDIIGTVFPLEPLRSSIVSLGMPPAGLEGWFAAGCRDAFAMAAVGVQAIHHHPRSRARPGNSGTRACRSCQRAQGVGKAAGDARPAGRCAGGVRHPNRGRHSRDGVVERREVIDQDAAFAEWLGRHGCLRRFGRRGEARQAPRRSLAPCRRQGRRRAGRACARRSPPLGHSRCSGRGAGHGLS